MKNNRLSIIALSALAACSSGGGESTALLDAPKINFSDGPTQPVVSPDDIMLPAATSASSSFEAILPVRIGAGGMSFSSGTLSGLALIKGVDGFSLWDNGFGGIYARNVEFSFASDFKEGANFIYAEKTTHEGGGIRTLNDMVVLGGKKLGLEYADFGVWKRSEAMTETLVDGIRHADVPFYVSAGKPSFAPTANKTFIGKAVGSAYDYTGGNNNVQDIVGTATLSFDAGTNRMAMNLSFDNFYTFAFTPNFTIATNATSYGGNYSTTATTVTGGPGNTGISFASGNYMAHIRGQFFGATPTAPSETAGTFMLNSGSSIGGASKGIIGAFGAKAQ